MYWFIFQAHKKLLTASEEERNASEIEKAAKVIDIELEYAESLNSWVSFILFIVLVFKKWMSKRQLI